MGKFYSHNGEAHRPHLNSRAQDAPEPKERPPAEGRPIPAPKPRRNATGPRDLGKIMPPIRPDAPKAATPPTPPSPKDQAKPSAEKPQRPREPPPEDMMATIREAAKRSGRIGEDARRRLKELGEGEETHQDDKREGPTDHPPETPR